MSDVVEVPEVRVEDTAPEPQDAAVPLPGAPPPGDRPDGDLVLEVDGKIWGGWDRIAVTRSCEALTSGFSIGMTEKFPGELTEMVAEPGMACRVIMGRDVVLSGWIDTVAPALDARTHTVTLLGRSRCCDLVDCAADLPGMQISGQTVGAIARMLAEPYGVSVLTPDGDGPVIPQIGVNLGESPVDVIARLAAFAGLLVYDDADGNLVLAKVGQETHSSGIVEGENLLSCHPDFGRDDLFSEYRVYSFNPFELQEAASAIGSGSAKPDGLARDENVKRRRIHVTLMEHVGSEPAATVAQRRAEWEASRRSGKAEEVAVTVDAWRDSAGRLWEPNRRAVVRVPTCHVTPEEAFVIAMVTYQRDERGTSAQLRLMPARAFAPEFVPYQFSYEQARAAAERQGRVDAAEQASP